MAASIKMALFAIASVLFQFGLAIFGEGGFSAFFSHPALDALAIATLALTVVALFAGANISSGEEEDRSNRWVLVAFSVIAILIAYFPAYTDRMGLWTIDGDSIRWVGVALLTGGGALRIWPVYVLGNRFSGLVAIQHEHKLVTSGVYSVIRNPSYLGLLVSTLGWALAFRSLVGVMLAAMMIPPLVARMGAEERLLHAHFGSEYEAYCKRTWRLIPRVY